MSDDRTEVPRAPDEPLYKSDPLYKKDSRGNIRVWQARAMDLPEGPVVETISGLITGKRTVKSTATKATAKLTAQENAVSKVKSSESSKLKKGYFKSQKEAEDWVDIRPMLLHKWDDHAHKMVYPAFTLPKLDGVCAVFRDTEDPHFMSREGNRFPKLDAKAQELSAYLDDRHGIERTRMHSHGELYAHGYHVGEVVEAIKGDNAEVLKALDFHVFDFMTDRATELQYKHRLKLGLEFYGHENTEKPFRLIKISVALKDEDVNKLYHHAIGQGFEGLVICNTSGYYEFGRRTYDKLKKKDLMTEEFEITGTYKEDNDGMELIMFRCKTSEGVSFNVRPKWNHKVRAKRYQEVKDGKLSYLGAMATVEYRSLTAYRTPFHGVLLTTRDYE